MTNKEIIVDEIVEKWLSFANEMLEKYKTIGMFQATRKARCSEKIFMAIAFLRDLNCPLKQLDELIQKARLVFEE